MSHNLRFPGKLYHEIAGIALDALLSQKAPNHSLIVESILELNTLLHILHSENLTLRDELDIEKRRNQLTRGCYER